mmetsp:Transcript_33912/g.99705  ORF Transcript_33912/g.99705 Transcript_33912/m.99705 type:complete len:223 (-) Transcript_33912:506-1174(-)
MSPNESISLTVDMTFGLVPSQIQPRSLISSMWYTSLPPLLSRWSLLRMRFSRSSTPSVLSKSSKASRLSASASITICWFRVSTTRFGIMIMRRKRRKRGLWLLAASCTKCRIVSIVTFSQASRLSCKMALMQHVGETSCETRLACVWETKRSRCSASCACISGNFIDIVMSSRYALCNIKRSSRSLGLTRALSNGSCSKRSACLCAPNFKSSICMSAFGAPD